MCACGRGAPGWKLDPGVCPNDDDHGPANGHCACCHEPDGDGDRRLPVPVTAVDVDALAKLREALAAAVRERLPRGTYNPAYETDADDIADALLPVVDRIANERAAAAREEGYEQGRREVAEYLDRVWQESHRAAAQALGEATS